MSAAVMVPIAAGEPGGLSLIAERARDYARRAKSPATQLAYKNDWKDFSAWCDKNGLLEAL